MDQGGREMKTKTKVKAGGLFNNHNQTVVRRKKLALKDVRRKKGGVRTKVKAGTWPCKW
jgi:hypothetical protein